MMGKCFCGQEMVNGICKGVATNKNSDLLSDFVNYCVTHPEQRFWQALRNWSGFNYIWVSNHGNPPVSDTYLFEGKDR
jgi:hypothetical protein